MHRPLLREARIASRIAPANKMVSTWGKVARNYKEIRVLTCAEDALLDVASDITFSTSHGSLPRAMLSV